MIPTRTMTTLFGSSPRTSCSCRKVGPELFGSEKERRGMAKGYRPGEPVLSHRACILPSVSVLGLNSHPLPAGSPPTSYLF